MDKNNDIILVTGATGNQGGAVARYLLKSGYKVRAMTRKSQIEKAGILKNLGAEVVQGDFDDAKSLELALEGVRGVFSVQNTWEAGVEREEEQGKRFAEIAKKKGIYHFVYSSVGSAHRSTGIPHFENKWRIADRADGARTQVPFVYDHSAGFFHGELPFFLVSAGSSGREADDGDKAGNYSADDRR